MLATALMAPWLAAAQERAACEQTVPISVRRERRPGAEPATPHQPGSSGLFLSGLRPEQFRVKVDKRPHPVTTLAGGKPSRRVLILLDASGSMESATRPMRSLLARSIVAGLLDSLDPQDAVGFGRFTEQIDLWIAPTNDRRAVYEAVAEPSPREGKKYGRAVVIAAAREAIQRAGLAPGDSVLLVTEDASRSKGDGMVRDNLQQRGVRLFAALFPSTVPRTYEMVAVFSPIGGPPNVVGPVGAEPKPQRPLGQVGELAQLSGGEALAAGALAVKVETAPDQRVRLDQASQKLVAAAAQSLAEAIDTPYWLRLEVPPSSKGSKLEVEVVGENGKKLEGVVPAYPRRLPPCRPAGN